jgi:hypothetical protein
MPGAYLPLTLSLLNEKNISVRLMAHDLSIETIGSILMRKRNLFIRFVFFLIKGDTIMWLAFINNNKHASVVSYYKDLAP